MAPIIRQTDNADHLPPYNGSDAAPYERPYVAPRTDWAIEGVRWAGGILAMLILYWLIGRDVREWLWTPEASTVKLVIGLVILLFVVKRLMLVRQPGGYIVSLLDVVKADAQHIMLARLDVEKTHAGTSGRLLAQQTYSPTYQQSKPEPRALIEEAQIVENPPALIPDQEWLGWIDRTPHLLLAGRTDAGKTTFAEAILAERIHAGDQVLICDPHYQPGKWHGIEATSDIEQILTLLSQLDTGEMRTRFDAFNAGQPTESFQRLTILLDEVPAIVEETFRMTASGTKRIVDDRWQRFARRLGSQARKVRISVILMSQTIFVEDLMINSAYRENFVRVGLGDKARPLLAEESRPETKRALYELLRGQEHPAAFEHNGEIHLLDTARVPALASRRIGHLAQLWQPPAQMTARPVVSAYQHSAPLRATASAEAKNAPPTAQLRVPLRSATPVADLDEQQRDALVQALRRRKWTQDAIRDELRKGGLTIAQDRLVALCQAVDRT